MSHRSSEHWTAAVWHHLEMNYLYFCEIVGIIYCLSPFFIHKVSYNIFKILYLKAAALVRHFAVEEFVANTDQYLSLRAV